MESGGVLLSLIIPVYNACDYLEKRTWRGIKEIKRTLDNFEIIFVNDGSTDRTLQILEKIKTEDQRIKILSYNKNRGKGYAVKMGILKAVGEFIFFTDADLPFGISPILESCQMLENEGFDMILAQRSKNFYSNLKRKIASRLFSFFVDFFFGLGVLDTQCGLKGFKREIAKDLFNRITRNDFTFDVEIIYLARKKKLKIGFLLVKPTGFSNSTTISFFPHAIKMLINLIIIKLNILKNKYDKS